MSAMRCLEDEGQFPGDNTIDTITGFIDDIIENAEPESSLIADAFCHYLENILLVENDALVTVRLLAEFVLRLCYPVAPTAESRRMVIWNIVVACHIHLCSDIDDKDICIFLTQSLRALCVISPPFVLQ